MSRFSDDMCKCADTACTTRVTDELRQALARYA